MSQRVSGKCWLLFANHIVGDICAHFDLIKFEFIKILPRLSPKLSFKNKIYFQTSYIFIPKVDASLTSQGKANSYEDNVKAEKILIEETTSNCCDITDIMVITYLFIIKLRLLKLTLSNTGKKHKNFVI